MENLNSNNLNTNETNTESNTETNTESNTMENLNSNNLNTNETNIDVAAVIEDKNLTILNVMSKVNIFINEAITEYAIDKKEFFTNYVSYLQKEHKIKTKVKREDTSWKKQYASKYLGRGNRWLKTNKDTDTYNKIIETIDKLPSEKYVENIEREGYAWFWFSKVVGTKENPHLRFEVRINTSKEYHPEITFDMHVDDIENDSELLGGTPHKFQIEVDPKNRKTTKVKKSKKKNIIWKSEETKESAMNRKEAKKEIILNKLEVNEGYEKVKEETTEASEVEVDNWNEFLEANGLLDEE